MSGTSEAIRDDLFELPEAFAKPLASIMQQVLPQLAVQSQAQAPGSLWDWAISTHFEDGSLPAPPAASESTPPMETQPNSPALDSAAALAVMAIAMGGYWESIVGEKEQKRRRTLRDAI
jgi:hypothetical protein